MTSTARHDLTKDTEGSFIAQGYQNQIGYWQQQPCDQSCAELKWAKNHVGVPVGHRGMVKCISNNYYRHKPRVVVTTVTTDLGGCITVGSQPLNLCVPWRLRVLQHPCLPPSWGQLARTLLQGAQGPLCSRMGGGSAPPTADPQPI